MKPGRESQTAVMVASARAALHGRMAGVDFQDPTALALLPEEARRRVEEFRAMLAAHEESCVAVVGHGTFLRHLTGRTLANCEVVPLDLG